MTITTSWTVELKRHGETIDVSSRTMGATIQQSAPVGSTGSGTASVQLDNSDGALTPFNGGTYAAVNFYEWSLQITARVTDGAAIQTRPVYHGIINDFDLVDDGRTSTVTLSAVDALTLASVSKVEFLNLDPAVYFFRGQIAIDYLLNGYETGGVTVFEPVDVPLLGADSSDYFVIGSDVQEIDPVVEFFDFDGYTIGDFLNSSLLPTNPMVIVPTRINFVTSGGAPVTQFQVKLFDGSKCPSSLFRKTFVLADDPATTELPFSLIDRGYNMESLVNSTQMKRNNPTQIGGAATEEKSFTSTASLESFGRRNIDYSTLAIRWDDTTANFGVLEPGAQQTAERWGNMYDTPRFLTREVTVSAKQVEGLANDAALTMWSDLLDTDFGIWHTAKVRYSPTGGSERTDRVVLSSRTISISPEDCVVVYRCLPMQDNMNFILDDSDLGKLGGGTDAYDESGYTYDEPVGYEGLLAEGNRIY